MKIKNIQQFNNELKAKEKQVIVLFYNKWNASSMLTQRILEEILLEQKFPVRLLMIDADVLPELMKSYGIHKIPSILFFRNKKVVYQLTGLQSKADIETKITEFIEDERKFNSTNKIKS